MRVLFASFFLFALDSFYDNFVRSPPFRFVLGADLRAVDSRLPFQRLGAFWFPHLMFWIIF